MSEIEQLRTELARMTEDRDNETNWAKQYHDDWVKVRDEFERVQKQATAMRDALTIAKRAIGWESLDNEKIMGPICAALQPDAGSDYFSREQVKPLVEALTRINEISVVDEDMGCAVNWAGDALEHAKILGLL